MSERYKYKNLDDVPNSAWEKISRKSIYFGHHSVGSNIVSGIIELLKENQEIKLNIKETYNPEEFTAGTLAHSRIGYNFDPQSKLIAFDFYMNAGGANATDISTFKYCFLDFSDKTDVTEIFDHYKVTINRLKQHYPDTVFLHSTVPLTTIQSGMKATVKKILGRSPWGVNENMKRNQFNELIRETFGATDHIFDIATVESTFPDGRRSFIINNDKKVYTLAPEYSSDGSHLNEIGRKVAAEQFLVLLANIF